MFVNEETGKFYKQGDIIRPKEICETYKLIANEGGNALYNGSLAKKLAEDIGEMGGIITQDDLAQYRYWHYTICTHDYPPFALNPF